jgi:hypothetical protein
MGLPAVAGVALMLWMLLEAFEAMVLPRRIIRPFRLTHFYYRASWTGWKVLAALVGDPRRRQTFLSFFGPLSLFGVFVLWGVGLVVGFGLVQWDVAPPGADLLDALYFSGVTFTTLGYGDITPKGSVGRVLAVVEGATGFGFFAVMIGYLPALYQAFSKRETLISLLDARAGSPPAAAHLLLRLPPRQGDGVVLARFLQDAEVWSAELLESHLSFPTLSFYRSQHDNQSWLAALVCALDVSALLLTVVEGTDRQQARLTFAMARHALVDLALVLRRLPEKPPRDRLPEARLTELCTALHEAGVPIRNDATARAKLGELRGLYEPFAAAMADDFLLTVADIWPATERPDNWQTSAWMRRAGPLTALGVDPRDDHFD